jgi:hypothetical protein
MRGGLPIAGLRMGYRATRGKDQTMKRREFFEKAGLGSGALLALPALVAGAEVITNGKTGSHQHEPIDGPLAVATVAFGNWAANPRAPLDRFPNLGGGPPPTGLPNGHQLIPYEANVKAGGVVNFIIAGFHQVLVYAEGWQPEQINVKNVIPPTAGGPPLINDANGRLYRGMDPSLFPQDRVEAVSFPDAGTYLVICGVLPHFANDHMFGFVKVNP